MFEILGLHHVTAIVGDPQESLDFYTGLLGLRLVKLTVNYDDPGTYHFYFGDAGGHPGTIMTTFPWPGASPGRPGSGQVTAASYEIGVDSLEYWLERLLAGGVSIQGPFERFGEKVLAFTDPYGVRLELVVAAEHDIGDGWKDSPVPAPHQLRFFHSVTLTVRDRAATADLLAWLGFERMGEEGERSRFRAQATGRAVLVDLVERPGERPGTFSAGAIHHVAFRIPDDEKQETLRKALVGRGLNVSPVMDRSYFRSIYFREPGGVLFEFATDPPGFSVDEPSEELGTRLSLPGRLEPMRRDLEKALPPLRLPVRRG